MEVLDVYPLYNVSPVRGEGAYVFDEEGKPYLDLYGGHAVISIGHSHPVYVKAVKEQVANLGFYSNSILNPLQDQLALKLGELSNCREYRLFLCNSGAEANENALKLASFHTGRSRVIYFKNAFHGRTSGVVAVTDNDDIKSPFNQQHLTTKLAFEDTEGLEKELAKEDVAGVILEVIQGVGGLNEASTDFYQSVSRLCRKHGSLLITDEVQSGYGRTGDFFAFQKHVIKPDIISVAKGMGNGFPVGGILVHPNVTSKQGMLGTTFGGNHLACAAANAVLDVIDQEDLLKNAEILFSYFKEKAAEIPEIKRVKGRGLMLGLEFDFEVASLRKNLLFKHQIFTGAASNKNLLRILPPLNIQKEHFELFFSALNTALLELKK